ncbi:hypothetical protein [Eisenibacter elegans]|uniref:hypothetical protein n=1 Tax=Eisenibacter elegans TaxID=997 RepID=UPI00137753C1|nr:hypothetical protein [Eisenibacter elegans]
MYSFAKLRYLVALLPLTLFSACSLLEEDFETLGRFEGSYIVSEACGGGLTDFYTITVRRAGSNNLIIENFFNQKIEARAVLNGDNFRIEPQAVRSETGRIYDIEGAGVFSDDGQNISFSFQIRNSGINRLEQSCAVTGERL